MAKLEKNNHEKDNERVTAPELDDQEVEKLRVQAEVPAPVPEVSDQETSRLHRLMHSRKFQIIAPAFLLVLVAVGFFVQPVKFAVLNLFTSGKVKFVVVDDTTLAPVSGATVSVGSHKGMTDKRGMLTLTGVDFGDQQYSLIKESYATKKAGFVVNTGDNLVGPVKFHSDGFPVEVRATNKLSGAAMTDFAVAIDGTNVSAQSNKAGVALLKVPSNRLGKQTLAVTAKGFNKAMLETNLVASKQGSLHVSLTMSGRHYFLSNRDGVLSVYGADLDGSNQTLVVKGSSSDDDLTSLVTSPDGKYGALVSKREQLKDASGKVIPALYLIDYASKTVKRIDEGAPTFYVLGWTDNTHVAYSVNFSQYDKADNSKLKTADLNSGKLSTIGTFPGYPSMYLFQDYPNYVYVLLADPTKPDYGLFAYNMSTKARQQIEKQPISYFAESKPGYVLYSFGNDWREMSLKNNKVQTASQPTSYETYHYVISDNGQKLAWVENRDGKGAIILANSDGTNSKQLTKAINFTGVKRWISADYVIATAVSIGETADYIVSTSTGQATKISDVYYPQYR